MPTSSSTPPGPGWSSTQPTDHVAYAANVPEQLWWIVAVLIVLAATAAGLWTVVDRRRPSARYGALTSPSRKRPPRRAFRPDGESEPESPRKVAAFVVNPTKVSDLTDLRVRLTDVCRESGWAEPLLFETTPADPGGAGARSAVAAGADVVVAVGGDGTTRSVAEALADGPTPMAVVPLGTTNLFARNLDIPTDSLASMVRVALTGASRRVDLGTLTLDVSGEDQRPGEHTFLVMAGLGVDGEVMATTSERAKARIGWSAYVLNGLTRVTKQGFKARITTDEQPEFTRRTRSILVGNCGRLTGGIVLMPDARVDDGTLDAAIISPRGPVGWAGVVAQTATKRHFGHARVEIVRCTRISIRASRPTEVQVDGDHLGSARTVTMTVRPRALSVRVPLA